VGLIALSTDLYWSAGRFVLCVETLPAIGGVIWRRSKWSEQLSQGGEASVVVDRVGEATRQAVQERVPRLGGTRAADEPPTRSRWMRPIVGYIRNIDASNCTSGLKRWIIGFTSRPCPVILSRPRTP